MKHHGASRSLTLLKMQREPVLEAERLKKSGKGPDEPGCSSALEL
jgi:hypothetical protein